MSDNLKDASIEQLLQWNNTAPGEANRFKLVMLHRTVEAMNGLSNRLDEISTQAEINGRAQGRQQSVMIALTCVLAIATVAYTVTTIWSTMKTLNQGGATQVKEQVAALPTTAAIHMGTDESGRSSICINGIAYEIPVDGATTIHARYPFPAQKPGEQLAAVPPLKCKN